MHALAEGKTVLALALPLKQAKRRIATCTENEDGTPALGTDVQLSQAEAARWPHLPTALYVKRRVRENRLPTSPRLLSITRLALSSRCRLVGF